MEQIKPVEKPFLSFETITFMGGLLERKFEQNNFQVAEQ